MKRLVFALVAVSSVVAVAGSAVAADLPVRAAPAAPPLQNWTGWYVGLNAGGAWGNDSSFDNSVLSSFCNAPLVGCASSQFSNAAAAALPSAFDPDLSGFIGGGQFGYNYQIGQVVWGFEADFQGTSIKGDGIATGTAIPSGFPAHSVTVSGTGSQKLDFLGTVRGRLGWTWDNPWLVYVTGGLAYGHTKTSVTFTDQVGGACLCGPNPVSTASSNDWRAGWTVGAGLEWKFAPQWSLRGEYLYYDLGSVTLNSSLEQLNAGAVTFFNVGITSEAKYRGSIARAAVNYHF